MATSHNSVSVTDELDYFNDELYIIDNRYKYAPRWMRIRVVEIIDDRTLSVEWAHAISDAHHRVRLLFCACGKPVTRKVRYADSPRARQLCRRCDQARITSRQRWLRGIRRSRELAKHTTCAACDCAMIPDRVTRRYCSSACRQEAYRLKGSTAREAAA